MSAFGSLRPNAALRGPSTKAASTARSEALLAPPVGRARGLALCKKPLVLLSSALLAAGCAVGPNFRRPQIELAPAFVERPAAPGIASDGDWWSSFGDPLLVQMVDRACASTPKMREAAARLREARALRSAQFAGLFPKVDGNAGWSDSRISEHGFFETLAKNAPAGLGVFDDIGLYQLGFDAQWEIDVFGHVRRSVEAAGDEVRAAEAGLADAARSIAAETAREVVEIRADDERIAIARRNIETQRETLDILHQRRAAGIASEADVARVDGQLAAMQAATATLSGRRAAALHRLEVLVAANPGTLDAELAPQRGIPEPSALPATGLPSDLLLHRPDVARSEAELAAATARIGVARAELFPRFSLTGSFGVQSQQTGDLLTSDSRFWYVGPGMKWPIFDAGRLCAAVKAADARTEAAAARYEHTLRVAVSEVETALSSLEHERERETLLDRQARDEALAADASRDLYRSGLSDLLHVLDAERSRFVAEDQLAASRAAVAEQSIALFKALGGGWSRGDADRAPVAAAQSRS